MRKKCDRFFLIYYAIPGLARTRISRWRISSGYNWISISPVMWWGSVRGERHCVSCKGQRQQYWTDRVAVRSTQTKWSASRGDFMDPTQPPEPVPPAHLLNSYIASRSLSFVAPRFRPSIVRSTRRPCPSTGLMTSPAFRDRRTWKHEETDYCNGLNSTLATSF